MALCSFGKISLKGHFEPIWPFGTDLYARLFYLSSNDQEALIVALDTLCTLPRETDRFRERVAQLTGIPEDHIWYHELQVHAAPDSDRLQGAWMNGLAKAVAEEALRIRALAVPFSCQVAQADLGMRYSMNRQQYVAGLGGVTIWTGMEFDENNRPCSRHPERMLLRGYEPDLPVFDQPVPFDNPVDSKAYLFVFKDEEDKVIGTLSRFAAHPDVAVLFEHHPIPHEEKLKQYHYDFDWPGTLSERMEAYFSAPSLYLNGPCADLAMKKGYGTMDSYEASARECRRLGNELADALQKAYEKKRVPLGNADNLKAIQFRVELPMRDCIPRSLKELDHWEEKKQEAEEAFQGAIRENAPAYRVKQLGDDKWRTDGMPYLVKNICGFTEEELNRRSAPVTVSALQLGDYLFVGVPGESLSEMGIWLRSAFTGVKTIPVDQVNGYYDYMVTPTWLTLGGYTYWASWISREAIPLLKDAIVEKLDGFLE